MSKLEYDLATPIGHRATLGLVVLQRRLVLGVGWHRRDTGQ